MILVLVLKAQIVIVWLNMLAVEQEALCLNVPLDINRFKFKRCTGQMLSERN